MGRAWVAIGGMVIGHDNIDPLSQRPLRPPPLKIHSATPRKIERVKQIKEDHQVGSTVSSDTWNQSTWLEEPINPVKPAVPLTAALPREVEVVKLDITRDIAIQACG